MPARRRVPRKPRRRVPRRARRIPRTLAMNPMSQSTTVIETINFNRSSFESNNLQLQWFKLSQFPRAAAIAPYFKFYKAEVCIWTYEPYNNLYAQDASLGTALTIPYIYNVMNRTQDLKPLIAVSTGSDPLSMVQTLGGRPKTFTKKVILKYKPNYLMAGQTLRDPASGLIANTVVRPAYAHVACPDLARGGAPSTETVLPINVVDTTALNATQVFADQVSWGGHLNYVEQKRADDTEDSYSVVLTVKWHFKQPNYIAPGSLNEPPVA